MSLTWLKYEQYQILMKMSQLEDGNMLNKWKYHFSSFFKNYNKITLWKDTWENHPYFVQFFFFPFSRTNVKYTIMMLSNLVYFHYHWKDLDYFTINVRWADADVFKVKRTDK